MPPIAPSAALKTQALEQPYKFLWGVCPKEHLSIRVWLWGEPSDEDPVIIRCASKAVARSVVAEHNRIATANPEDRRRRS